MKMVRRQTAKAIRQRFNYYKTKGYGDKGSAILATSPGYVLKEFNLVKKLHGKKHALSWLKGKYGRNFR